MGRTPPPGAAELFAELTAPAPPPLAGREGLADLASAQERLLDHFQATGPGRFFAGPGEASTPALFERLDPEARDRVIAAAESVRLRRFDLLGYRGLSFGDPVDWHLDPVSGRRWPPVHWSLIEGLDAATVGDMKVVWELSRHQFLVTLGVAYRATGDERYAEAFAGLIRAWIEANPRGIGVNWASSLEAALRLISWCWALFLFRKSQHLTPGLFVELLAGIKAHASHVERYLSHHFSPNTHLTGEALGLFYAGVLFPEMRPAARWRALGRRILEEQVRRQVLSDGVYFEQTTGYQRYTVEIYLHYLLLARRNGPPASAAVDEAVQKMLDVLLALRRPDGGMPAIGDADGGSLLPLAQRGPNDMRGTFGLAAAVFGRADYAWAAEGVSTEALWLLGPSAVEALEALAPEPPREASRVFAKGGYAVMRTGWRRDAHHLVFDVGPLGCPISAAHGHADLLGVQVSAFGEPYVVDPGTFGYADRPWRDYFRGSAAHATVLVDGQGQATPAGPFAWREMPRARLQRWISTPVLDLADADHEAYGRLQDPVLHRRRVVLVKQPGYWVIVDDLAGKEEHQVEVRFPFAPMPLTAEPSGWVRAAGSGGRGLLLRSFARAPLAMRIEEGSTSPVDGWISPDYGQRQPAPILIYGVTGRLPLRILTLLLPTTDVSAPPPAVSALAGRGRDLAGLFFEETGDQVWFGDDDLATAAVWLEKVAG